MKKIILVSLICGILIWLVFEYRHKMFSTHILTAETIDSTSIDLLKERFKLTQVNSVISGLSVVLVVDMLANGAQGKSLEQLEAFLNTSVKNKNAALQRKLQNMPATLKLSNSIWGNKFNDSYKTLLKNTLNVSVQPLPSSTDIINNWIREKTHGTISSILKPEATNPQNLYLVNTIYFKDNWVTQFDYSHKGSFFSLSKETKEVPMMKLRADILYAENDEVQSVALPYKKGGFMILYLPKGNFESFISNLSADKLYLDYQSQDVQLSLPKFKIDNVVDIKELFQYLGINEIFNISTVDFEKMSEIRPYVKNITQRAIVEIDEKGTVASAATVAETGFFGGNSKGPKIIYFQADRPFLFFITNGNFIGLYTGEEK